MTEHFQNVFFKTVFHEIKFLKSTFTTFSSIDDSFFPKLFFNVAWKIRTLTISLFFLLLTCVTDFVAAVGSI